MVLSCRPARREHGVLTATLALGTIWAAWHLPLFVLEVPGLSQRFVPLSAFVFMSLAMRYLFSWSYHRGDRSVMSNVFMHNGLNFSLTIVTVVTASETSMQPRLWCVSGLAACTGFALWRFLPPAADRAAQG